MNLQHMKYAVAVAETGSINKAADRLFDLRKGVSAELPLDGGGNHSHNFLLLIP